MQGYHNGAHMARRYDVDNIKRALADPAHVARVLGLAEGSKRQAGGLLVRCPAHGDRTPSCSLTRGPDGTLRVKCFGCDLAGDVFALVKAAENLEDFPATLARCAALAGVDALADAPPTRPQPAPAPPRPPPPVDEVRAFWERCQPTAADPIVASWLKSRAIDPAAVDALAIARALPIDAPCPRWARYRGDAPEAAPWSALGYRAIVPTYDAAGDLAGVRARFVGHAAPAGPKSLPPAGYGAAGFVMACPLGVMMLSVGAMPWWAERRIVIAEGEPDWLTWASCGDVPRRTAVIGLAGSGSWSQGIADRIPDGSEVIVRTDPDDAGDRYALSIALTLRGRCRVVESDPQGRAERRRAAASRGQPREQLRILGVGR